ncbi:MAG: Ig-like domain-containing protein, partial [Planctomycetaceae bacterium]
MTIRLDRPTDGPGVFEVTGLPASQLAIAREAKWTAEQWRQMFAVFVEEAQTDDGGRRPAMLGEYRVTGDAIQFQSRFPLEPGLTYLAVVSVSEDEESAYVVRRSFAIPKPEAGPPTTLTQIYPTRDTLPENLLKFYLHFSAAMSQGDSYRHLHLIGEDGKEVELPFLELGQELWTEDGLRLTVLFDPGRIKRGLKPREEEGPSIERGKRYTLVIDGDWPDAAGRSLRETRSKTFSVTAPDSTQPDVKQWKIKPPAAGTRRPLVIRFAESLDHAILQHALLVVDDAGRAVSGTAAVDKQETRWKFRPDGPWPAGDYSLVIETRLED